MKIYRLKVFAICMSDKSFKHKIYKIQ
jgi:hypothetical protein